MTMLDDEVDTRQSMTQAIFERPTALSSLRRYWYLVIVCALLAAGVGAVYAFKRPPVYTASSRLAAFSINNSNAASVAGSLQAGTGLASTFAREVQSTRIVKAVAAALNTTPAWVGQHLSGTPIPDSPIVRIDANASTPGVAITSTNTALKSLTSYAQRLLANSSNTTTIMSTIRTDSIALSQAENQVAHLKGQAQRQESNTGATTPSPGLQKQTDSATAVVTQAQTRLSADQSAYASVAAEQAGGRTAITPTQATVASSDRKQVAQVAILLGLVIGGLIGGAGALWLAGRSHRTA
jgi:capsular polysaccharide biosynthesis protein